MHVLDYKYEIFQTNPQKSKVNELLSQCSQQWNHAVSAKQKLYKSLNLSQISHIISLIIDVKSQKQNSEHYRKTAIDKFGQDFPGVPFEKIALLYDLSSLLKKIYADHQTPARRIVVASTDL